MTQTCRYCGSTDTKNILFCYNCKAYNPSPQLVAPEPETQSPTQNTCRHCGVKFNPADYTTNFCSQACYKAFQPITNFKEERKGETMPEDIEPEPTMLTAEELWKMYARTTTCKGIPDLSNLRAELKKAYVKMHLLEKAKENNHVDTD